MFVLAGLATVYCGVAVMFAKYGKAIRLRSQFAQNTMEVKKGNGLESVVV